MMTILKTIRGWTLAVLAVAGAAQAVENPNVPTTFNAANTVPSENRQSRRVAPPAVSTGNDMVTGNVGGMRHFRGVVPYGSTYYSGANLGDTGTSSVNAFIRRSVNPIVSDRNPALSRPYYQPSQAASTFRQKTGVAGSVATEMVTGRSAAASYDTTLPSILTRPIDTSERPLSVNNRELDLILSRQFELRQAARNQRRDTVAEPTEFDRFFDTLKRPEIEPDATDITDETPTEEKPERRVLDEFQEQTDAALIEQESVRTSLRQQQAEAAAEAIERSAEDAAEETAPVPETITQIDERLQTQARGKVIRGEHPTFESLAQAKFTDYMAAAEQFVVEGHYYRAADTYDLAAIWSANDPRPYAGKSFALLAAGEYMSSAYYLSRAIEITPALAQKPVDIAKLLGDRDTYENRLLEIVTWQQRSQSPELAFLSAYLYYHDDKAAQAATAIDIAQQAMPDSAAVKTLRSVITGNRTDSPSESQ